MTKAVSAFQTLDLNSNTCSSKAGDEDSDGSDLSLVLPLYCRYMNFFFLPINFRLHCSLNMKKTSRNADSVGADDIITLSNRKLHEPVLG